MSRFQKKCLVASFLMHGLLCLVLVIGPAFSHKPEVNAPTILELLPADIKLTDGPTTAGGTPPPSDSPAKDTAPPLPSAEPPKLAEKPVELPKPAPDPVPVKPTPVKPEPKPEIPLKEIKKPKPQPEKELTSKVVKNHREKEKPEPKKPLGLKPVVRNPNQKKEAERTAAEAREREERRQNLAKLLTGASRTFREKNSGVTTVELAGPGAEAFVQYKDFVFNAYKARYDRALLAAGEVAEGGRSEVHVSVTIARDGKVINSRITRRSGNTVHDKLVQRLLDNVTTIAPFPEGAKDAERTFEIIFDLDTKRQIG